MSTGRAVLRWVGFIPAGIVAAGLVAFPIHWLVMINLGGYTQDPLIEIRDPETLRSIEMWLRAVLGPLAFVYCAARIVPDRYSAAVSYVLAGAVVVGLPIVAWWWWWTANTVAAGSGFVVTHGPFRILANIIGVGGAIYLIRRRRYNPLTD